MFLSKFVQLNICKNRYFVLGIGDKKYNLILKYSFLTLAEIGLATLIMYIKVYKVRLFFIFTDLQWGKKNKITTYFI